MGSGASPCKILPHNFKFGQKTVVKAQPLSRGLELNLIGPNADGS